ncbi:PREDICTED: mitogen-activated protein kinase 19-like [Tarenaya hassleriana]|nr:PREDICTED: mitogen-activated protein kinase 19-like [Tarenaya hassleriana]XP_019057663.1 PREDICTED: mitogen-activated protein kinase 19-like [Tarenaya hassleriana]
MGKPLFPGKSIVHQLELITDLLGTPSLDTISGVRNEKARKYLTGMRKKNPIPFSQKFSNADPLALRLMQRLLAFDPKDRPTAAEALSDPYFKGLAKVEREPSCQPISKLEFEFERRRLTKDDIRELIYREILEYHPQLLKDYMNGSEGSNFVYPSAIGHLRKQFAYLEENSGRSGPVIPLERKHVSLPRSTVHSSLVHSNFNVSDSRRGSEEASRNGVAPSTSANPAKSLGPPPRAPSGRPGRVVESSVPRENGRILEEACDSRSYYRNTVLLPPQTASPHCFFRTNPINPEKQPKPQYLPQCQPNKPAPPNVIPVDMNPNPYFQPQSKTDQLTDGQMAMDAKLLQAHSQYGAVGAAAVAVASHRSIGTIRYGSS